MRHSPFSPMRSLSGILRHINESLAAIRHFRPAWRNRYTMDAPLTEEGILEFEKRHGCRLPEEYREFLRHVGVSGIGPDYGLFSPLQHFSGSGFEECLEDNPDLSMAFPHMEAWNDCPDESTDEDDAAAAADDDYFSSRHSCGSLIIGDRGCALWTRIIITGPSGGGNLA